MKEIDVYLYGQSSKFRAKMLSMKDKMKEKKIKMKKIILDLKSGVSSVFQKYLCFLLKWEYFYIQKTNYKTRIHYLKLYLSRFQLILFHKKVF